MGRSFGVEHEPLPTGEVLAVEQSDETLRGHVERVLRGGIAAAISPDANAKSPAQQRARHAATKSFENSVVRS